MNKTHAPLVIDYDANWRWLIERHPLEFIQFFLPSIYPLMDVSVRPKLLSENITKIGGSRHKKGGMTADLVLEVRLLNGDSRLLHIHIEVQAGQEANFGWKS